MPANLTPDYLEAEREFKQARDPDDKVAALRRMLATLPKHKGTEKIQADLKRRLAKLNEEIQTQARRKGFAVRVEREGAGQVAIVGPPNAGKSRLVQALTGVGVPVAPHPYTTQSPIPAMMPYQDIRIQLIDLPPVSSSHTEVWVPNLVRTADAVVLVVDLSSSETLDLLEDCRTTLEAKKVLLVGGEPDADPWASVARKKTLLVGSKLDLPGSRAAWGAIEDLYSSTFPSIAVSGESLENVEALREKIFRILRLVRVYSKPPHHEADRTKPFVLREGSTLLEFADTVHHDFAEKLKFARVWGHGKFDGQRVNKDYIVADGDVVELHA